MRGRVHVRVRVRWTAEWAGGGLGKGGLSWAHAAPLPEDLVVPQGRPGLSTRQLGRAEAAQPRGA